MVQDHINNQKDTSMDSYLPNWGYKDENLAAVASVDKHMHSEEYQGKHV
jgi:hypothetical protein